MRWMIPLAACIALSCACMSMPAHAAPPAEDADREKAAVAAPEPRRICTRECPVGTNRPARVCRDAAEVERSGERAREAIGTAQTQRYMPPEIDPR